MKIKKDESFGVVPVFKNERNEFMFCVVKHDAGHWGFPKGHTDGNEAPEDTARRELKEETGIDDVEFQNNKIFTETYSFDKENIRYEKKVKYFLGFVFSMEAKTPENFRNEIPEMKWVTYKEAKKLITFSEALEILDQVFLDLKNT